ncbi:hypothetical protein DPMN_009114 [Dreissena polymorpha]|uniref:Uncharacterized protein n=1 Tax=Dreissena polymorpha TaxID=45954 RepID=A0A9D4N0M8_DREPO|nr:hypothetical protein DPMN_009114 [Dreissena polymorpha]
MSQHYCLYLALCLVLGVSVRQGATVPTPPEFSPPPSGNQRNIHTISLMDIFNQRVNARSEMCPRHNVVLFLLTRNNEYLHPCIGPEHRSKWNGEFATEAASTSRQDTTEGASPSVVSGLEALRSSTSRETDVTLYPGSLFKRILNKRSDRTAHGNTPTFLSDRGLVDKRVMWSINSALASLGDPFHHEKERARLKMHRLHSDLLRLG